MSLLKIDIPDDDCHCNGRLNLKTGAVKGLILGVKEKTGNYAFAAELPHSGKYERSASRFMSRQQKEAT